LLIQDFSSLEKCKLIFFPKIADRRGNLSFIEENRQVPFDIKRIFFLYDVPSGASRGGHAHKELQQIIIALSGSFDVILDDGFVKKTLSLNRPHYGLYIPPGIWSELTNFSSNSLALSLASDVYNESDYIRDYEEYKRMVRSGGLEKTETSNYR
jgi:oxalate decarboxylase/phosphoglucose isomerase-like protein (cupin superfamily)